MTNANTSSSSPYVKYMTPSSELGEQPAAANSNAPLQSLVVPVAGASTKPLLMRAKVGRLPIISVSGDAHDDDRERLYDVDGDDDEGEDDDDDESEDDAKLLETSSKVVTTKSLRLQRVTRLIEASQGVAASKIKKRKKVTWDIVFIRKESIFCVNNKVEQNAMH
jgi:hypothetical protein